jgi:hypothetical protein
MSIFTKLFQRTEDGDPASADAQPAATPPAAERAAPARPAVERAAAAPSPSRTARYGAASVEAKASTTSPSARPTGPAPAARPATSPRTTPAAAKTVAPASPVAPAAPATTRPSPTAPAKASAPATARVEEAAPTEAQAAVGSVDIAFDRVLAGAAPAAAAPAGGLTASDRQAVMSTFEALAVGHAAQVRSLMLEVRWGDAQTSWLALCRPAIESLAAMAKQVEHADLGAALDGFRAALDEALRPGAAPTVAAAVREKLLAAYAPLATVLPAAFELEGERDRREPLVVRALLAQVPGLEPLMTDRLMAAGLCRLEALFRARADEVAAVAGVPAEVAAAIVAAAQGFRRATPAALATPDPASSSRELSALVQGLATDHGAFEDASRGWSEADRAAKRRLRRRRDVAFHQITIALARLGEVDLALALEKMSFARRLEELGRLLARLPAAAPAEAPARRIGKDVVAGAHAAP